MKSYPQLATRIFGVPLLIERHKLETILAAVGPRLALNLEVDRTSPAAFDDEPVDSRRSRKAYEVTSDGIALIDIVGPLVKRASGDFLSGGPTTYGQIESEFTDAFTDPAIHGVLLQVDSPGGESTGCFELASLIHSQREAKPIVAAIDGDAYSAAYALASAAEEIYLLPSGGAGSIGVWMMHQDWSEANARIGYRPTYIFAGARKIDGNPDNPLSDEARTVFEGIVQRTYSMFVECVARNRGLTAKAVQATDAGLFFGPDAVSTGLADSIGTTTDAMKSLRARIATKGSVARSAANSNARSNMKKLNASADTTDPQPDDRCPACNGEGKVDGADCQSCGGTGKATAKAAPPAPDPASALTSFSQCRAIVELCAIAGLSARASLSFLRSDASMDQIRSEILTARVEEGGKEINSHVMPDAGSAAGQPGQSGIVKKAEAMAAAAAAKSGGK